MGLKFERDGDDSLTVDDRHFPVAIARWDGRPTQALAEAYFRWHDAIIQRAESGDTKVVFVTEANAAKQPDASTRKFISDASIARMGDSTRILNSYVALDSAVLRGVLTVIGWVMNDTAVRPVTMSSLQAALERALEDLQSANIPPPLQLVPEHYRIASAVPVAS